MYKKIRKSVAEIISTVQDPEQFQWNKWLKEPQIYLQRFPKPRIETQKIESFNGFIFPSLYQIKKFELTRIKISSDIKNVTIKKRKTFKVFFNFIKPYQQKITIFDSAVGKLNFEALILKKDDKFYFRKVNNNAESTLTLTPNCFEKPIEQIKTSFALIDKYSFQNINYTKHDFVIKKANLAEQKFDTIKLQPNEKIRVYSEINRNLQSKCSTVEFNKLNQRAIAKNIRVAALEEIKNQLESKGKSKTISVDIKNLDSKPKLSNIRSITIEKETGAVQKFKNISITKVKAKLHRFDLIEGVKLFPKNYLNEILTDILVLKPEIPNELIPKDIITKKNKSKQIKFKKNITEVNHPKKKTKKEVLWEDVEPTLPILKNYQKEGIKSLLTKKNTVLCDALGIDTKFQVVHALNYAINYGVIKNALIVCPDSQIGNKEVSKFTTNCDGWENQFQNSAASIPFVSFRSILEYENAILLDEKEIYITNYKTLNELVSDPTKSEFLRSIECLVLHEAQYLLNDGLNPENLYNFPLTQFYWILSSLPQQLIEERLIPKLRNHIAGFDKIDAQINRTIESLGSELPQIVRTDYWLDNDSDQQQEFENTLAQGQKRISEIIKGGNPFIIQSNIFTLIHQIKQIGNFSTYKETSPKANLLLDQLESIISSGQKCIIFSQYDKQGIQKIERLLQQNHIKFLLLQSGMSMKEIESAANSFKSDPKIRVMLASLTAANIKIKIPESPYLIHFDQWWNPIYQWQIEDRIINFEPLFSPAESTCSINYFSVNPIELKIRSILEKRGLLVKNLIEYLSNEALYSLVTNEDWFEILGIENNKLLLSQKQSPEEILGKLSESSTQENGQKIKAFFAKLGFKNLRLETNQENNSISIHGLVQKGLTEIKSAILFLPFNIKDIEPVENFIKEASKHNSRLFIICADEILDQALLESHDRIVYIGAKMLANYFSTFNVK